jgi:hypothetical protein
MTAPVTSTAIRGAYHPADRTSGAGEAGDAVRSAIPEPGFVPVPGLGPGRTRPGGGIRRARPATPSGAVVLRRSPIRRILDETGGKVDLERITKSTDVTELNFWLNEQTDWEEMPSDEEAAAIKARIAELQPTTGALTKETGKDDPPTPVEDPVEKARAEAERRAREFRQQFEAVAGKELPNFDGATARSLFTDLKVPKKDVGAYFLRCADVTLNPATVLSELAGITIEAHLQLWGVLAFVDGATLVDAKALAALDLSCLTDVAEDFSIDSLVGLIDRKVLTVSKHTYRVTKGTGANGVVYQFELTKRNGLGPMGAEWHVHFGVRDAPENPGFKHKTKDRQSERVETNQAGCTKLKKAFGSLWGVDVSKKKTKGKG